jgi:uncharacterized Zn finger protein
MTKRRKHDDDYDDDFEYGYGWGYFPRSKPRKAADGIKSKNVRGAFGETWWARRWITVLESYSIGSRLQRGRTYARAGQVLDMAIQPGTVTARVQGSRATPYKIRIDVPVLPDSEWERAIDAMSAQAIFAAKLLSGEMPNDIEDAFNAAKVPLFPARGSDLATDCSCPDFANPCKHIAAVYYLIGEQFDADPFLIFTLRGRTRDQIIEALRKRRAAATRASADSAGEGLPPVEPELGLSDQLGTFWDTGDLSSLTVHIAPPEIEAALLRRLGASPAGTQVALKALYAVMTRYAQQKALGE